MHFFKDGKEEGISRAWHENGQFKSEVNWIAGKGMVLPGIGMKTEVSKGKSIGSKIRWKD